MAITALAGPVSNFVLAYVALLLRAALLGIYYFVAPGNAVLPWIIDFLATVSTLSVALGLFNLIHFLRWMGPKSWGVFCLTGPIIPSCAMSVSVCSC